MFVGYANGLFGYCPTRRAKDQGGYGSDGRGSDWGELSRDLCVELLREMHGQK